MENKKTKNILLAIMGIFVLAELVAIVISLADGITIFSICQAVALIFVASYGFWLYKKPHGNLLKYALLLIAGAQLFGATEALANAKAASGALTTSVFFAAALVYVAGRLNRIDQNKILLPIIAAFELYGAIWSVINFAGQESALTLFSWFSRSIMIFTLMIAYFVRYKEHKEAGISDK